MKAIRVHSYGHSDQLKLEETPRPQIGDDEILVHVRAAGVNPVDWKIREGLLKDARPQAMPFTPGQDVAGEVVAVGGSVRDFSKGEAVFGLASGAYAEYAKAKAEGLARKPDGLEDEQAASVPVAALTAWQALEACGAQPGQRLLIHGAGGGVGSFAAQLAKARGMSVAATAGPADVGYLRDLGVDPVIDYRSERFEDELGEVDAVIDLVGGETQKRSYAVLRRGGTLVTTLGQVDEKLAAARGAKAVALFMKPDSRQLTAIARMLEEGRIKPRIDTILPLDQARWAQDLSQSGQAHGKVVLRVA